MLLESCRQRGFGPEIVHRSEREDWIQMMVAAGRGVTLMPESLHLGHGTLARPLVEPALDREVSLVTVAGRPHAPAVQHLIRAIRAYSWAPANAAVNRGEYREPRPRQQQELPQPELLVEGEDRSAGAIGPPRRYTVARQSRRR